MDDCLNEFVGSFLFECVCLFMCVCNDRGTLKSESSLNASSHLQLIELLTFDLKEIVYGMNNSCGISTSKI